MNLEDIKVDVDYNPEPVLPENKFQFDMAVIFRAIEYIFKVILSLFGLEDM
ncbi:MAG: hypothetical protein IKL10_03060 [Clostridia bacterium]|nr:hypothetical protein [Clostridia bacterium]